MIIDLLENSSHYETVHQRLKEAFHFLKTTDLNAMASGTYNIDNNDVYAIVREYETLDITNEEMESHRDYLDVQYMIKGAEVVGHALLKDQAVSKEYNAEHDFTLYADAPSFFTKMEAGTFMIFLPTDLHVPCLKVNEPAWVKKIVVKVRI